MGHLTQLVSYCPPCPAAPISLSSWLSPLISMQEASFFLLKAIKAQHTIIFYLSASYQPVMFMATIPLSEGLPESAEFSSSMFSISTYNFTANAVRQLHGKGPHIYHSVFTVATVLLAHCFVVSNSCVYMTGG